MVKRSTPKASQKSGFTMLECVVAILVINLTIAGLLQLLRGQEKQLSVAREQLEIKEVVRLRAHPDPIARALGMPALVDSDHLALDLGKTRGIFELEIIESWRGVEPARFRVVFEQSVIGARP